MIQMHSEKNQVCARQVALFAAFVLPVYKLVETPSLLSGFVQGDLLLPALLSFLGQTAGLIGLLFTLSRSKKSLFELLVERFGRWAKLLYAILCILFLTLSVLPVLDLDKFVYAVFYDTSPTVLSSAFFFIFSAFLCTKGLKTLARLSDLSLFLFLFPFLFLIALSLVEADFTNLLPFFEKDFGHTMYAMKYTKPHFCDLGLLFPLLMHVKYKKGDGVKIATGYAVGALLSLIFLAVFYGLYSSIAPREHYAFAKIAQYFPVLAVVGRIDLFLVYLLCITFFIYVATPILYAVEFASALLPVKEKTPIAVLVNIVALFFLLFCNKYYNSIYAFFGNTLFPVFCLFDLLPLLPLFLFHRKNKESAHA